MFETLDYTIRIGSTPTFLYLDLYLYSAYTQRTTFICFDIADSNPTCKCLRNISRSMAYDIVASRHLTNCRNLINLGGRLMTQNGNLVRLMFHGNISDTVSAFMMM